MSTTSPRTVKTALATLFNADDDLTDVTFHTSNAAITDLTPDYVVLGDVDGRDEPFAMSGKQRTIYRITCSSRFKSATADAAFDKAWTVKDAIAAVLATGWTVSGNTLDAQLGDWEINETYDADDGRVAALEFEIVIQDTN